MKWKFKTDSIVFKWGLLSSGVFLALLVLMATVLYGAFTSLFIDHVKEDLLIRGKNHANVLSGHFDESTIEHVVRMETDVTTRVLVTDSRQEIIASSVPPDEVMMDALLPVGNHLFNGFIEQDWENEDYIVSVSAIGKNEGFVYMYYPSEVLREFVRSIDTILLVAGTGIIILALIVIAFMSKKLAGPLITMKEATNKMALGKYRQAIPIRGEDEVAELGRSIQSLGEQLQEFEDSRNDFLASVSHELRTPLTYLKGYSDVLLKGIAGSKAEEREYLEIIHHEANRISSIVGDLLDASMLQAGQYKLRLEKAELNPLIEKAASTLRPAAAEKGIRLHLDLANVSPCLIDKTRIEQAIYNLVENAIKYTHQGEVTVVSRMEGELAMIEVKDTGLGIPENDLPKIFNRFYRVEQSHARKTGGSGLGLYFVKNMIEAHGGEIRAESKEGEGSVFTVYLHSYKGEEHPRA